MVAGAVMGLLLRMAVRVDGGGSRAGQHRVLLLLWLMLWVWMAPRARANVGLRHLSVVGHAKIGVVGRQKMESGQAMAIVTLQVEKVPTGSWCWCETVALLFFLRVCGVAVVKGKGRVRGASVGRRMRGWSQDRG